MEKTCEFCGVPRPVVYCQADAAFLCLSCDAKVHSANALSGRHSRDLVCDSCREGPAFVRCLDHSMLLCRGCESRLHEAFSRHKKLMLKSFTGCPSAKHFAALWGFNFAQQARARSESCVSSTACGGESDEPEMGSSNQQLKTLNNDQQEENSSLIMQQILDLKKLQLTEDDNQSSPTLSSSGKLDAGLDRQLKELEDLQSFNNPSQELKSECFLSPMSQLDHLSCSSSVGGDSCCQHRGSLDSSQFWSQNLQDLGVCEDLGRLDDFDMPDVDVSFRNFDDLFTSDVDVTRPLLEDHDFMWSDIEKDASIDESGNIHTKTTQDVSASSISIDKNMKSKNEAYLSDYISYQLSRTTEDSPHLIRSPCSASFSPSRLSVESSGSDFLDIAYSANFTQAEGGEGSTKISKERKKARLDEKQSQLAKRKTKADTRKRIKGRVVNVRGYGCDTVKVTKSY